MYKNAFITLSDVKFRYYILVKEFRNILNVDAVNVFEGMAEACRVVDNNRNLTIVRRLVEGIGQIFYSSFVYIIIVFKGHATTEIFNVFRIDDVDTCLSTEAFKYLLQAPLVIIALVRTEGPVSTSGEVYHLLAITRSGLIGQLVVVSLRCSRWEVWCFTCQSMRFPSDFSERLTGHDSTGYATQGNAQTRTSQGLIKVVIKGFCQTWCRWINAAHR